MQTPKLHQTTPHVYWLSPDARTDRPILGAISGEHATLIVDGGNSPAHARLLLEALAKVPIAPLGFLVLTHWHWDHVFGAATFEIPAIAALETRRKIIEMAGLDWSDEALDQRVADGSEIEFCRDMMKIELPDRRGLVLRPPEIGFDSRIELDLGGLTCQIVKVGGDHDPGSTIIYVQEDRLMFISDCLGQDYYSGLNSYSTAKLFPLIDQLLSYQVDFYLEGHAEEPLSRQQMVADLEQLRMIGQEVERTGPDRDAILSVVQARLGEPLNPDHLEIIDSFLAGLGAKRPPVEEP
jgi:glyoxylase-like metal-dependent hydrolase (beta-lactamase superfamily II)